VTGCRLEELCALKKADVLKRKDGYWFVITEGKTEAAIREVPVHASVNHVVERRGEATVRPLREIAPGAYGRRSHHVSKAYRRYREMVGVGERGQDFHALRSTFTGVMEGAGVPIHTIQLLIGHSRRATMGTTAIYAHGERVDLRKAISKLRYPSAVMRLLRTPESQRALSRIAHLDQRTGPADMSAAGGSGHGSQGGGPGLTGTDVEDEVSQRTISWR
jgi:integrase